MHGKNDFVLKNVDTIHCALRDKKKIEFTYWEAGLDGEAVAQHDGEVYVVSPMRVTFADGRYYLTGFSDKHQAVREYRVDRMRELSVSAQKAHRAKEITDYAYQVRDSQYFGRFDGDVVNVTLRVEEPLMPEVIDRFGRDANAIIRDDGAADVHASVRVSPQFFGWIAGMDGLVGIEAPESLRKQYRAYLLRLAGE